MEVCPYCNCYVATTKEHLLPQSFIKDIHRYFPYTTISKGDHKNIIHVCYACNHAKANKLIFPTVSKCNSIFKNLTKAELRNYAEFLYSYKIEILGTMSRVNNIMKNKGFAPMYSNELIREWEEFCYIYEKGYFY